MVVLAKTCLLVDADIASRNILYKVVSAHKLYNVVIRLLVIFLLFL